MLEPTCSRVYLHSGDLRGFAVALIWLFLAPVLSCFKSMGKCEPNFPHLQNGCCVVKGVNGYKALTALTEADSGHSSHGFQPLCSRQHPFPSEVTARQ